MIRMSAAKAWNTRSDLPENRIVKLLAVSANHRLEKTPHAVRWTGRDSCHSVR